MKEGNALLWQIAGTFAAMSLVAVGGANAVVPEIHRQVVANLAWMDDPTFSTLFAIAQAAPGPNVLIVSLIGWHMAGFAGLMVATVAMAVPSCTLAFVFGRIFDRLSGKAWIARVKAGLIPIAIGLIMASGAVMAEAADRNWLTIAITAGTAIMVFVTDWSPLWALAGGAAISIVALWVGVPMLG